MAKLEVAECGAEWEVRLLNVRLNMKLTVWPTMRLNGRLLNGRLKCQAGCGAELNNMMLNVRVKCTLSDM